MNYTVLKETFKMTSRKKALNEYEKSTFCWLPNHKIIKHKPRTFLDIGHFVFLRETLVNHEQVWNMIEVASCPVLARKYHTINIAELLADEDEEKRFLGVGLWFVLWSQSVGVQYFELIRRKHSHYALANTGKRDSKPLNKWRDKVIAIIDCVKLTTQIKSSPNLQENCIKAGNFILEPGVLIQLPWHPILLHQWLLASLVEVLMFERESLELRHWPMPKNVLNSATNLLTAVRKLKERITLGLLMLMQTFIDIKKVVNAHQISNEVIKPSIPTLQFLITGKAHNVVKSIKKIAWSKSQELNDMDEPSFMSFRAFYMDADLLNFYITQCYNYDIWNSNDVAEPFPDTSECDIDSLIERLNSNESLVPDFSKISLVMKPYNLEEKNFHEYLEHNQKTQFMKLTPPERIELTIETICELILEPGRIKSVTPEDVKSKFNVPEVKRHAREIFNREIMKEATHLAIGYTMMYWQAYVTLIGGEKENTVIGRVVSLGLEVIEREQMIRLTNACCALFHMCPVAIKLDEKPALSIPDMLQLFKDCQTESKIYFQLPQLWMCDLNLQLPAPERTDGVDNIVKIYEQRLGTIVNNSTNYVEYFPEWQIVQYVLPGFVASYVKITERKDRRMQERDETNYLAFLHNLVRYYENKFSEWQKLQMIADEKMLDKKNLTELNILSRDLNDRVQILLGFYTNSMDTSEDIECIPGYKMLSESLITFPNIFLTTETDVYDDVHDIFQTWQVKSFKFLKLLYRTCLETFKPPIPGITIFKNDALFEMYYTESIICNLVLIFKIATTNEVKEKLVKLVFNTLEGMFTREKWKRTLYKLAYNPDIMSKNQINAFISEERKPLMELYINLKKFRDLFGKINISNVNKLLKNETYLVKKDVMNYLENGDYELYDELFHIHIESIVKQPKARKQCRKCGKLESRRCKLIPCEQCIEVKYPDVNYFCSSDCKQEWWNEEHMAEHLEFDLGLSDFSNIDINN